MKLFMVLGYLGSGKSTFVSRVLGDNNKKVALIINEFADDVDSGLLDDYTPIINKIEGGSIFCNCKSHQFVDVLKTVVAKKPDIILVESSGMANPCNMMQIINFAKDKFLLDIEVMPTVCFVDALNIQKVLCSATMVAGQIAQSDIVFINKEDVASNEQIKKAKEIIGSINSSAVCRVGSFSSVSLQEIEKSSIIEKVSAINTISLNTQKVVIELQRDFTVQELDNFCKKIESKVHRIKGRVNINNCGYVYQYVDSSSQLKKISSVQEQFIVLLSCSKDSIRKNISSILLDGMEIKKA